MTAREAVAEAERELALARVPTPRVDAEWIVAHVARVRRSELPLADAVDADGVRELVARRARREPLAYVLGEWGFRRLTLRTDPRALVPRPETEVVVERALALLRRTDTPRVLDVGTGSGAIALAIADEHPAARVTGVDISSDALALARENAERLRLEVELREGGVEVAAEGWDLVVANPPYVSRDELDALEPELAWEPREALVDAGMHEELARRAHTRFLVVEIGDGQAGRVAELFADNGYTDIVVTRDLAGTPRVVEGQK